MDAKHASVLAHATPAMSMYHALFIVYDSLFTSNLQLEPNLGSATVSFSHKEVEATQGNTSELSVGQLILAVCQLISERLEARKEALVELLQVCCLLLLAGQLGFQPQHCCNMPLLRMLHSPLLFSQLQHIGHAIGSWSSIDKACIQWGRHAVP